MPVRAARGSGAACGAIGGQHMAHACSLGHGGHHGHTEQAPGSRVVRQAQIVLHPTEWQGVELALSSTNAIERMA